LKQFQRFLAVGALGFFVDFSVLYLAVNVVGVSPFAGRLVSFIIAATVTWKANRHFTFATDGQPRPARLPVSGCATCPLLPLAAPLTSVSFNCGW
jgi:putative flippase GtrA